MQKIVKITKESGIPLIGHIAFGIIDRGSSLLQIRPTTVCNLNCTFCSTDGGPQSKTHKTQYIIDPDYLIQETNKIVEKKGQTHINIDSVGEPASYKELEYIIQELKKNPKVYFISMQSNGTYFTKERINNLEKAGLDRIHLSIHSTNTEQAKKLMGTESYNLQKVMEIAEHIAKSKIQLLLAPVWLPKVNDEEIEKIIQLAKTLNCKVGIQKYEGHKYGRKIKGMKETSYYHFYKDLKALEKKYEIKLVYNAHELNIMPSPKLERPIQIGEKINTPVIEEGWFANQKIVKHRNRAITVKGCNANKQDKINVKVVKNKNNIYLAETI